MRTLGKEEVARLIYETEQRIHYGHVRTPWETRPHDAAKQHVRKIAELIDFAGYDVIERGDQ